jgi:hypothetical protein
MIFGPLYKNPFLHLLFSFSPGHPQTAIALGNYFADVHSLLGSVCHEPEYMNNSTTKPYYIPFRVADRERSSQLARGRQAHGADLPRQRGNAPASE